MKPTFSRIASHTKAVLAGMALTLSASSFAGDVAVIGYDLPANGATIQVRKIETNALDAQKHLVMKTILYVHDTEADGKINSQIIGTETRVYNPDTAQVTHVSVVGIAAYPVEANGAYIVTAPGARNVSIKGDNNKVTLGGDRIPLPGHT